MVSCTSLTKSKNTEELKEKLEQARHSIAPVLLRSMFNGMKAGMEQVIELNDDYIGKWT